MQVIAPELAINKTSDKKEYAVGETGHYNVEVVQTKDDAVAKNIHVIDKLDKVGAEIQKDSIKVYDGEEIAQLSVMDRAMTFSLR